MASTPTARSRHRSAAGSQTSTTKPSSPCCSAAEQLDELRARVEQLEHENAILSRRNARGLRTLARLEDLRESGDRFLRTTIRELRETEALLRERHEEVKHAMTELEQVNSELLVTQERLVTSEGQAKAANRAKSAFLANMSHELRTPLTAIIGFTEFLLEDGLADRESALEDLARVQSSGRHLLSLVNEVLDLSKIEAGHYDMEIASFDLAAVVDEVLSTATLLIEGGDNQLCWERPAPIMVMSDPRVLRQSLLNLVSNAAKFTAGGTIGVRCEPVGDSVRLHVSDTGIGMSAAALRTIFEEFSQADASTSTRFGGTGLGLTITKRLLSLIGAGISVTSVEGSGSTFTITMPMEVDCEALGRVSSSFVPLTV